MTVVSETSAPLALAVRSVSLQPAAIFSIFDQYQRRSELCSGRLIGAIFGTRSDETQTAVISQAFPIPHSEIKDQVNINSEQYKSRSELLRTCYGKSLYVLGWYSIALSDVPSSRSPLTGDFATATSFIHDVFSKEIVKSSPVTVANSALHLEVRIDAQTGAIDYGVFMATERGDRGRFSFVAVSDCQVSYALGDAFAANAMLLAMKQASATDTLEGREFAFPAAQDIVSASVADFGALKHALSKLTASPTATAEVKTQAAAILARFPDPQCYRTQADKFASDLRGLHTMIRVLCDQLTESQRIFFGSQSKQQQQ